MESMAHLVVSYLESSLIVNYYQHLIYLSTSETSGMQSPGLLCSAMVLAHALPNTTESSKELAPNLLAPCTLWQAHSPQA